MVEILRQRPSMTHRGIEIKVRINGIAGVSYQQNSLLPFIFLIAGASGPMRLGKEPVRALRNAYALTPYRIQPSDDTCHAFYNKGSHPRISWSRIGD